MSDETRTVYAVMVNYRTPKMTISAMRLLSASKLCNYCLIPLLVDNGSADGSADQLVAAFPDKKVIALPDNLGFAGGNNAALNEILADLPPDLNPDENFVLLINSDIEVEPSSLQKCLDFILEHPEVGIVGPKVVLPDGRLDLACRRSFPTPESGFWKLTGLARLYPQHRRFGRYNLTYLDEDETADVDSVTAAFMLVRLRAILQVGLLDEEFFMYGEDLDWAYRIKAHGWCVCYYPGAQVRHHKSVTARRQPYRMIYEFYRAMWLFYRKHYAPSSPVLLNWLIMIGIVGRGSLALGLNVLRPRSQRRFT